MPQANLSKVGNERGAAEAILGVRNCGRQVSTEFQANERSKILTSERRKNQE
jgi:hypothetical protein